MSAAEQGLLTQLYRCFDADGVLLYIGITYRKSGRKSQHRKKWPWWSRVDRIEWEEHYWRRDAEKAELDAIKAEKPLFNKSGVVTRAQVETRPVSWLARHEEEVRALKGEYHPDVKRAGFAGVEEEIEEEPFDQEEAQSD